MRLYLAVAVLMLAFVAYTEAQDQDVTLQQRFDQFSQQVTEMGQNALQKTKDTFENIQTSDFAVSTKKRFDEYLEKMKTSFGEIFQ